MNSCVHAALVITWVAVVANSAVSAYLVLDKRAENAVDWNKSLPCFNDSGLHPPVNQPANETEAMFLNNEFTGYKQLQLLGKGAFGVVYRVLRLADKKQFALKIAMCSSLRKEYEITRSQQHHDFVIRVEEYGRTNNSYRWDYYVMQLVGKSVLNLWFGGQLRDIRQLKKMLNELVVDMGSLHNLANLANNGTGVAHNDLHPGNFAIHPQHKDRLVIFDFGFAKRLTAEDATAAFQDYNTFLLHTIVYFDARYENDTDPDPFKRKYALPYGARTALNSITGPLDYYYRYLKPKEDDPPEKHATWANKSSAAYIRENVQQPVEALFRSKYWIGETFGKDFLRDFIICNADTLTQHQANAACWGEPMVTCSFVNEGPPAFLLHKLPAMFHQKYFPGYSMLNYIGQTLTGLLCRVRRDVDTKTVTMKIHDCGGLRGEYELTRGILQNNFTIAVDGFRQMPYPPHWDYFVMPELGPTLAELIGTQRLTHPLQLMKVVNQLFIAVTEIHSLANGSGIAHMDLRLENIAVNLENPQNIIIFNFAKAIRLRPENAMAVADDYASFLRLFQKLRDAANETNILEHKFFSESSFDRLTEIIDYFPKCIELVRNNATANETHQLITDCQSSASIFAAVQLPIETLFSEREGIGEGYGPDFLEGLPICELTDNKAGTDPCWRGIPLGQTSTSSANTTDNGFTSTPQFDEATTSSARVLFPLPSFAIQFTSLIAFIYCTLCRALDLIQL